MVRNFILKQAKKLMLKDGGHIPLVIAITADCPYVLPVINKRWNSDTLGREKALFLLERAFGSDECLTPHDLEALYLIHEAWFVKRREGEDLFAIAPSKHPHRQECLGILEVILDPVARKITHTYLMVEVLRHGGIIDLGPCEEIKEVQSNLLLAFLAGIGSAEYDDKTFEKMLERLGEEREI